MRYHRLMRDLGIALLCLPAGVVIGKLLDGHPKWPAGRTFDLIVTALLGLALLIVAGYGSRAEARQRKAEESKRDIAADLRLRSNYN
jgi:hypothetical protein